MRADNPAWEYRFYLDSDIERFIRSEYGNAILQMYKRLDPAYGAARADLFRYLLMYRIGGLYLDIKSTVTRPIDDIVQPGDRYLLSGWHNAPGEEFESWGTAAEIRDLLPSEYQQWHIVAAPGHPFLRAVIERVLNNIASYRPWQHGIGHKGVYSVTGPIAYTLAIHPLTEQYPHRYERYNDSLGLKYSIYSFYGHHALFKGHYVKQVRPVVMMRGLWALPSKIYCFGLECFFRAKATAKALLSRIRPRIT